MKSIKLIYKIGKGPSSSHTMGPERACKLMLKEFPEADSFEVKLYGSLAKTGKGHLTDRAVINTFEPIPVKVEFVEHADFELPHPNTMDLIAYKAGCEIGRKRVLSVGGGDIKVEGEEFLDEPNIYDLNTFTEIAAYCKMHMIRLSDYVEMVEGPEIWEYLNEVWTVMKQAIVDGLSTQGVLPGGLGVERKAQYLYQQTHIDESSVTKENRIVCAYAFAVSEQNASCGTIVTAPTCGACSSLPAVLKYMQDKKGFSDKKVLKGLAVAGLIGNIIKTNASLSGAECGCQAEIGSACSMAAAALCEIFEMGIDQIEYAAEVSMEHHLGLTCDPICGLVQIPCIERNAVAAMRAINSLSLANFLSGTRKISFDLVVKTMYETGRDLSKNYRETSEGGLAKLYQ